MYLSFILFQKSSWLICITRVVLLLPSNTWEEIFPRMLTKCGTHPFLKRENPQWQNLFLLLVTSRSVLLNIETFVPDLNSCLTVFSDNFYSSVWKFWSLSFYLMKFWWFIRDCVYNLMYNTYQVSSVSTPFCFLSSLTVPRFMCVLSLDSVDWIIGYISFPFIFTTDPCLCVTI